MSDEDPGWNTFAVGFVAGTLAMFLMLMVILYALGPTDAACAVCP